MQWAAAFRQSTVGALVASGTCGCSLPCMRLQAHTERLPAAVESWLRALAILRNSHGDGARLVCELRRDLDGAQAELQALQAAAAEEREWMEN